MKIYDVTFTYATTVVAQNKEEAEILAQNDVVTDCLECIDIQEKGKYNWHYCDMG